MYCMCLTNRQGADTDQNTPFSPRGSAGRFRSSYNLTARQEQHREVLGAAEILWLCPSKRVSKTRVLLRIYLWVCSQAEEGCSGQSQPCLPPGCGPCSWGCLPMSRAKGGQRILGCLVKMEQLGALLLASRAQGEEREGQTEIRQAEVRLLDT